ncbi:hypothetical protein Q1Z72_01435 [Pseudomonas qingdaonensis]|uniref:hypothetical protein n=1 Tax=Pseudomonas TaxID=286 RepID=UPI002117479F|nr:MULTISPECIES: hypothetical protein [Pseudomonas]UXH55939.1 hypothetical protein N5876_32855 [Pseudomonas aeruginosa]UXH68983.1 hypothetical protein N5879_32295 [Pseudomonas aeruginosa]WKL67357.1 hypothetical protein Q1Z72_01435 [Pseudomonas qingdaonensis]
MAEQKRFCIVASNHTGLVAAWEGDARENKQYLGNREVLAEIDALNDQAALQKWRAINQGVPPCAANA